LGPFFVFDDVGVVAWVSDDGEYTVEHYFTDFDDAVVGDLC